ncbi:MAG: hypothetical protein NVSMB6_04700 [Burkholderiaceae bacterium]
MTFFKNVKVEQIYQARCGNRAQAGLDIVDWIEGYYNRQRIRSSIGNRPPLQAEKVLLAA